MKMMANLKKVYERPFVEVIPLGGSLMQGTPGAELPGVSGVDPTGTGEGTMKPVEGSGAGDLAKEFTFEDQMGYGDQWDLW